MKGIVRARLALVDWIIAERKVPIMTSIKGEQELNFLKDDLFNNKDKFFSIVLRPEKNK